MTDAQPAELPEASSPVATEKREGWPRWKIVLIALAAMLLVAGAVLTLTGVEPEPERTPAGAAPTGAASSFIEGGTVDPPEGSQSESSAAPTWGLGFLRMGFSFFVGLSVGYLLRAFLRICLVVLGAVFLLLTWFAYLEFVTVNWEVMEQTFQGLVDNIGEDFDQLRSMLTGQLPQAGLATLGLVTGFKKR